MKALLEPCTAFVTLPVEPPLRAPVKNELSRRVQTLLDRGERQILLDLAQLAEIDAAGIGELVRTFNAANAAGVVLRIARPTRRVQDLLRVAGLIRILRDGVARYPTIARGA